MSLLLVDEILSEDDFNVDEKGILTDTRRWRVITTLDDTKQNAVNYTGVARYSAHPREGRMFALPAKCKQPALGFFYVTIGYTSKGIDFNDSSHDPAQQDDSVPPDQRPYIVSWGKRDYTKQLAPDDFSATPKPMVNAAGTPFDPPPSIPTSNSVVSITGYKALNAVQPMGKINTYRESVNADLYVLPGGEGAIPSQNGRCTDYHFEVEQIQGDFWRKFKIDIEIKNDGWNPLRVLNAGCYTVISQNQPPQPIVGRGGKPITKPVALAADGSRPLRANENPNYLSFVAYQSQIWTGAGNLI